MKEYHTIARTCPYEFEARLNEMARLGYVVTGVYSLPGISHTQAPHHCAVMERNVRKK